MASTHRVSLGYPMVGFQVKFETNDVAILGRSIIQLQALGLSPLVYEIPDKPAESPKVSRSRPAPPPASDQDEFSPDTAWTKLTDSMKANPRLVLRLIKEKGASGLSADQIADLAGKLPNWFTGVLNGGLQRNIKGVGFKVEDVIVIKPTATGNLYFPGTELQRRSLT